MLALVSGALAGSLFVEVGEPVALDTGRSGNWPRLFPSEDGWHYFFAAGGDYHHVPLDAALTADTSQLTSLTGRADLVDHAIAACPDGSWLHVASRTVNRPDDSATAFRYDAQLGLVNEADLFQQEPLQEHRDMPAVCAEDFVATAFFEPTSFVGYRLFELDADLAVTRVTEPEGITIVTGSSLYVEGDTVGLVGFRGDDFDFLRAREYDRATLTMVDPHLQDVSPPGLRAYWSQGLARVGERWVVAHMVRDDALAWAAQDGDVMLSVFNLDWRLLEQVQVTHLSPPDGAMQPWLTFQGDTLLVAYTRALQNYAVPVRIDRIEAGLDAPPDTGGPEDTGAAEDSGAPGDSGVASDKPCGCEGGAAWLLVPMFGLGVRRRR